MNIALIVIVYAVVIILLINPLSRDFRKRKARKLPALNPYRAVSLVCEQENCQQLESISGQKFLVGEVPAVPPSHCSTNKCACTYVHHEDRRSRSDRRIATKDAAEVENREGRSLRGRRKSDWSLLVVSAG